MNVFRIATADHWCGDYGRLLLQGIVHFDDSKKQMFIERVGPFIPDAAEGSGFLILPERELRRFLHVWGTYCVATEANITKAVEFDFTMEEMPCISDRLRGDPESVIIDGVHSDLLLKSMERVYWIVPTAGVNYRSISYIRSKPGCVAVIGDSQVSQPFYHGRFPGGNFLFCTEEFRDWVNQETNWSPFLSFEQVEFVEPEW